MRAAIVIVLLAIGLTLVFLLQIGDGAGPVPGRDSLPGAESPPEEGSIDEGIDAERIEVFRRLGINRARDSGEEKRRSDEVEWRSGRDSNPTRTRVSLRNQRTLVPEILSRDRRVITGSATLPRDPKRKFARSEEHPPCKISVRCPGNGRSVGPCLNVH